MTPVIPTITVISELRRASLHNLHKQLFSLIPPALFQNFDARLYHQSISPEVGSPKQFLSRSRGHEAVHGRAKYQLNNRAVAVGRKVLTATVFSWLLGYNPTLPEDD